jgi:hypothetical protein
LWRATPAPILEAIDARDSLERSEVMPGYFGFTNFEQNLEGYGSIELHLPSGITNLKGFDLNYWGVVDTRFELNPSF